MKSNFFQVILIVVFIALAIFGVLVFSGAIPIGNGNDTGGQGTVVLWGTVRSTVMAPLLQEFNNINPDFVVQYVEKSASTFDQDLLEALAAGTGPDMFFLPDNLAFNYADKIFTIPYQSYPLSTFKSNFAGAGEVFLTSAGIMAFPLSIDPLVTYYNRSMLDANGVVYPPAFWDEVATLVPTLTKKDDANRIMKSAVALGHFSNVTHAKDIVSALFMQAGNRIVVEQEGAFRSNLNMISQYNLDSVLEFYTGFANPNQTLYSWNRSFPASRDAFSAENLALYFGFASELGTLTSRNPNQNFLASPFPQLRNAKFKLTSARVTGIALLSSSKNFNTAFIAASLLSTGDFASKYAAATGVAPARRNLLSIKPTDAYSPIFYDSALYGRSWIDPSPTDTDTIFRLMIDAVLSNVVSAAEAIRDANGRLGLLLIR